MTMATVHPVRSHAETGTRAPWRRLAFWFQPVPLTRRIAMRPPAKIIRKMSTCCMRASLIG